MDIQKTMKHDPDYDMEEDDFDESSLTNAFVWERVDVLGVPVDIVRHDDLSKVVFKLLERKESCNIVLLSVWDLLRARRSGEYHNYVKDAALVIPISKSIVRGAKFLHGKIPERYMPFNFTVQLLTILEKRENSVCLLGGNLTVLAKTEKNMRQTFPKLRIVGRFTGQFKKQDEDTILKVIRKSAPTLLLVGKGVHGEERWIAKNTEKLNKAFRLWCSDLFEVFAERRRRPGRIVFERGLEWIGYCLQSPFRFFRFFPFVCYNILLLVCKLKKR